MAAVIAGCSLLAFLIFGLMVHKAEVAKTQG
jgi:hypothetical protein